MEPSEHRRGEISCRIFDGLNCLSNKVVVVVRLRALTCTRSSPRRGTNVLEGKIGAAMFLECIGRLHHELSKHVCRLINPTRFKCAAAARLGRVAVGRLHGSACRTVTYELGLLRPFLEPRFFSIFDVIFRYCFLSRLVARTSSPCERFEGRIGRIMVDRYQRWLVACWC